MFSGLRPSTPDRSELERIRQGAYGVTHQMALRGHCAFVNLNVDNVSATSLTCAPALRTGSTGGCSVSPGNRSGRYGNLEHALQPVTLVSALDPHDPRPLRMVYHSSP